MRVLFILFNEFAWSDPYKLDPYKLGAEKGFNVAQYNLGNMYEHGLGVDKDMELAKTWYAKAAAQDFKLAQQKMSEIGETKK